jgi:EmrB/QacA subfamily drug resistance transporter
MEAAETEAGRQHPVVTLAVLSIAGLSFALLQSMVAPALPDIQHTLGTSEGTVAWILTAYLLSASIATPIIGRLGDVHGKEKSMLVVLVILAVGTLISALATSIGTMILGRIIQGAGGGIFPLAFGIIRDEFPAERVAGSIGLMSAILGVGGGLGIVLAGPITDSLSYHWLFWLPLTTVLLSAVLTYFFVPESPIKAPGRVNWTAAGLLSTGLAALLLAISETTSWGWGSPKTIALITVGLVVLTAWVGVEFRARHPLVDMNVMRSRPVWTTDLVAFLLGAGMYSTFIVLPQFVETPSSSGFGFDASVTGAGFFMVPCTIAMLLVGPLAGPLRARVGSRLPLITGCGFAAAGFAMLAVAHTRPIEVYVAAGLLGIGIGLAFAAMANLIVEAVPPDQTGVATGVNTITRTIGGAFGGQIVATIIAGGGNPTEGSFTLAFAVIAGSLVLSILAGLAIPRQGTGAPESVPSVAMVGAESA